MKTWESILLVAIAVAVGVMLSEAYKLRQKLSTFGV